MMPWIYWPWLAPFWLAGAMRTPLSGDVTQDIAPFTHWFSPQLEVTFAGNRRIEREVVAGVASYGRQLGLLTEALLAVAGDSDAPAVRRLRETHTAVEAVKARHRDGTLRTAELALERLRRDDPAAFQALIERFTAPSAIDHR